MSERPPLLLDVCGTLYATNTSIAFLAWVARHNPTMAPAWFLGALAAKKRRLGGATPGDCMRARLSMLRGRSRQWIRSEALAFVAYLERHKAYPESFAHLQEALNEGREVWLVSATLEEILDAIAQFHPGVRILGSQLAYDATICRGNYREFLLETGKAVALTARMPADRVATAIFATDDLAADADLASAVACVVHVREGRWD